MSTKWIKMWQGIKTASLNVADIIKELDISKSYLYKLYEACTSYPKHSLLLEATLADGNNQRRMKMEPVSRHLGGYRVRFNNPFD